MLLLVPALSGVAKPRPTRASASGKHFTSYFRSIAICNDAVPYALLTSLFARLALILMKTCTAHTYVMGQNYS